MAVTSTTASVLGTEAEGSAGGLLGGLHIHHTGLKAIDLSSPPSHVSQAASLRRKCHATDVSTSGRRWSKLDLDEARRLYDSGLSFRQVGERLGFTQSYVAGRFRREGIPRRPSGRPSPTPAPEVDPAEIVRRKEAGESFVAIAAALGISGDMARDRYLQAAALPRRAPRPRH